MDETTLNQLPKPSAIVVGAGPVGMLLALGLHRLNWTITLVERHALSQGLPSSFDDRQLALTPNSIDWIESQQLLPHLRSSLTPILSIHSSAQNEFGVLYMSHQEMGVDALGYTLSQQELGQHLLQSLMASGVDIIDQAECVQLTQTPNEVSLTLQNRNTPLIANYLFAADGTASWVRNQLAIDSQSKHYPHQLMTAVAELSTPHQHLAIERFTAHGPTALLPLKTANQCKLVYCYPIENKDRIQTANNFWLQQEVNHVLGRQLGKVAALNQIRHYELTEMKAFKIQVGNVMLLGNAAHTQHPVAGQGLNLGIKDVQIICDWAEEANPADWLRCGQRCLEGHKKTMSFTDSLIGLFSNPNPVIRKAANLGMTLLASCQPLKRRITRMAMGY